MRRFMRNDVGRVVVVDVQSVVHVQRLVAVVKRRWCRAVEISLRSAKTKKIRKCYYSFLVIKNTAYNLTKLHFYFCTRAVVLNLLVFAYT
jgi:hypothetical protein